MAILAAASRRHSLLHFLARRHHRSLSAAVSAADDASPPPLSAAVAKDRLRHEFDPDKAVSVFSAIASPSPSSSFRVALNLTVRRLVGAGRTADIETLIDSYKSSPHASQEPFLATLIYVYGTAGMIDRAISLFEQVPTLCSAPPTVLSFNGVLSAFMCARKFNDIPDVFTKLSNDHSIVPNALSYATLIKSLCFTGTSVVALEKVREMEGKNIKPTTTIYTILLNSFYKEGKLDEATKVWTEMLTKGCQPNLPAYNIKASYLGQRGKPEEVRAVIADMESAGLKPDTSTYNHLITSYCKSGRLEDAKGVYNDTSLKRDHTTYSNFMYLLCESGDLDLALGVFNDILKRKKIMPDMGATGLLMKKLVKESREDEAKTVLGKAKEKLPKELLGPWEELEKKLGLVVEADAEVSYETMIKFLCISGDIIAGLEKLIEMKDKGIEPTTAIYNTILHSLYKEGKLEEAEKLWSVMLGRGCVPDVTSYNVKAMYQALYGSPEEVRAVMAEIESVGLKPDTTTYNYLITSYCKSGRFEDAKEVYKGLSVTGHSPNAATYDSFLLMLLEGGKLDAKRHKRIPSFTVMSRLVEELVKGSREEEAKGVVGEVKERLSKELLVGWTNLEKKVGLVVEADAEVSYETMIKSLCISGNIIAGLEKLIEMEDKGIGPTTAIYNTILHLLYKEGKLEEAEKLWSVMLGRGCVPDVTSYNVKAMYQVLYGTPEKVRAVMAEIESVGLKPDTTTYNYLITSYCKKGLFEEAKGIYEGAREMGWQSNVATFKNFLYTLCENGDLDAGLEVFNDSVKQNKIPFSW